MWGFGLFDVKLILKVFSKAKAREEQPPGGHYCLSIEADMCFVSALQNWDGLFQEFCYITLPNFLLYVKM